MYSKKDKNKNIYVNDNLFLPCFDFNKNSLLNKSIVLYGSRGSGKSIICKDIMYNLSDNIPTVIVFNTTENSNGFFSKIVSKPFIYDKVDLKVLDDIWKRQEYITEIYKKINNVEILTEIIDIIDIPNAKKALEIIEEKKELHLNDINKKIKSDSQFIFELNKIKEKYNEIIIYTLKQIINYIKRSIRDKKISKHSLSKEQLDIINFVNINPNILLIFDDCAAELKKHNRSDVLRKIFYNGRHCNITYLLTCQDELDLDSSLRRNANITILCDSNCCTGYFERISNSFPKKIKNLIREVSEIVYSEDHKNTKILYNKDDGTKLFWYLANIHDEFIFGSKYTLEYANKIVNNKSYDISMLVKKI